MQRLRPLSESECYVRCYGERNESVTLVEVQPHRLSQGELADPLLLEAPLRGLDPETRSAGWQAVPMLAPAE